MADDKPMVDTSLLESLKRSIEMRGAKKPTTGKDVNEDLIRADERKRCAADVCGMCAHDVLLKHEHDGQWTHFFGSTETRCLAWRIHQRAAKEAEATR